eukprot:scaffold142042_cov105-Phaeocystis_antarctica.AAC.1
MSTSACAMSIRSCGVEVVWGPSAREGLSDTRVSFPRRSSVFGTALVKASNSAATSAALRPRRGHSSSVKSRTLTAVPPSFLRTSVATFASSLSGAVRSPSLFGLLTSVVAVSPHRKCTAMTRSLVGTPA